MKTNYLMDALQYALLQVKDSHIEVLEMTRDADNLDELEETDVYREQQIKELEAMISEVRDAENKHGINVRLVPTVIDYSALDIVNSK